MMDTFRAWPGQADRCYICGQLDAAHDPFPLCPTPTTWLQPWMRCTCGLPLAVGAVTCRVCDRPPAPPWFGRLVLAWQRRPLRPWWRTLRDTRCQDCGCLHQPPDCATRRARARLAAEDALRRGDLW
jgi:hypothetical protein